MWIEFCNTNGGGALMHRMGLVLGITLSVALASGCSRAADEDDTATTAAARDSATGDAVNAATGEEVTVKGCLTAAADRAAFVVTADRDALTSGAIYAGAGGTPTYTYELMGNTGDLTSHVGRQVEVTGRLDADREDDVNVDKEEKTELPEVQSGDRKVEPTIKTETEMDINVRRLQVARVAPTGQPCQQAEGR
jgi:hypothetical protein